MADLQGLQLTGTMTCSNRHEFTATVTVRFEPSTHTMKMRMLDPIKCPFCEVAL